VQAIFAAREPVQLQLWEGFLPAIASTSPLSGKARGVYELRD